MQQPAQRRPGAWPAILTWRAHDVPRMESVRVQLSGNRIKAYGRIVAAATASHPAFSASYDLVTDESGATKRLSLTVTLAERERQLSIARDEENMWLVQDHQSQTSRAAFDGALDVDVIFSPFFNALPIRRTGLYQRSESLSVPVVYVRLPELTVEPVTISYSSAAPTASSCTRRSPTPRSPSTPTGSSSTTQDWQSGSDHAAGAAGGGQFVAPAVRADRRSSTISRPAEAVVAHPCGVAGLDEFGDRAVGRPARRGPG